MHSKKKILDTYLPHLLQYKSMHKLQAQMRVLFRSKVLHIIFLFLTIKAK